MVHELRIYTLWPGKVPEFLKLAEERARVIRGDDYGKCEGYWFSDIGGLNQIVHLWSYEDLNDRTDARSRLAKNVDWNKEYVDLKVPKGEDHIYEYRYYQTNVGQAGAWIDAISQAMPAREKYSQNICLWQTEAENPNEVSHMWVYDDLNQRAQARADANSDPDWQSFLKKSGSMLMEMKSTLLIPAGFSPLK